MSYADIDRRMKHNYEEVSKYRLTRRMPVAIRIDGKAFHTFTKDFEKPFDDIFRQSMNKTLKLLCENIQGCVFGYTQSDEITLILSDFKTLTSDAWFDYEVQKLCSISASMTTMYFNKIFSELTSYEREDSKYLDAHIKAAEVGAMFDSRCFNIPKEEVCNLIFSRQIDCERNAIQMIGQTVLGKKNLHKNTTEDIKRRLLEEKGVDWQCFSKDYIYGVACRRFEESSGFVLDYNVPLFKGEGRFYVEDVALECDY